MNATTAFILFVIVAALAFILLRGRSQASPEDVAVTQAINAAIFKEFATSPVQVDVKCFGGVVQLGGVVREYAQIERIREIALAHPGVREVKSSVRVHSGD